MAKSASAIAVNIALQEMHCRVETKLAFVIAEVGIADKIEIFATKRACLDAPKIDLVALAMAEAADDVRSVYAALVRGAENEVVGAAIADEMILPKPTDQRIVAIRPCSHIITAASGNSVGKFAARNLVVFAASVKRAMPRIVRVETDRDALDVLDFDKENILETMFAPLRSAQLDRLKLRLLEIERPGDDKIIVGVERKVAARVIEQIRV